MDKMKLNAEAITLIEEVFEKNGFMIEQTSLPKGQVDFIVSSSSGRKIKIKVKAISQLGSYVFVEKRNFDIQDSDLFMAVFYLPPNNEGGEVLYLIPAVEWGKNIYPFKGKDYNKEGLVSKPEWGINYSQKAKDAMEPYRYLKIIDSCI